MDKESASNWGLLCVLPIRWNFRWQVLALGPGGRSSMASSSLEESSYSGSLEYILECCDSQILLLHQRLAAHMPFNVFLQLLFESRVENVHSKIVLWNKTSQFHRKLLSKPRSPGSFIFFKNPLWFSNVLSPHLFTMLRFAQEADGRGGNHLPHGDSNHLRLTPSRIKWRCRTNAATQRGLYREFRGLVLCASHGWAAVLMMMLWCYFFFWQWC